MVLRMNILPTYVLSTCTDSFGIKYTSVKIMGKLKPIYDAEKRIHFRFIEEVDFEATTIIDTSENDSFLRMVPLTMAFNWYSHFYKLTFGLVQIHW